MPTLSDVAVVVVNFGSHELLRENLSACAPVGSPITTVIVDSFHSRAERDAVSELVVAHDWELVALPENPGFGAAANAGVARARALGCETVVLLNPDAVASSDTILALRAHVQMDPDALVSPRVVTSSGAVEFAGSRLYLWDGRVRGQRAGEPRVDLPRRLQRSASVEWLTGACLAVNCALFERIGGFATEYFLYWEDLDLSFRAAAAGARLVVRPDLRVVHDEGGTQTPRQGRAKSELYYYYNARNRLLFATRNLTPATQLRWMLLTPWVSWEILMRGGRRQLLHASYPLRAIGAGSCRGLLIAARALVRRGRRRLRADRQAGSLRASGDLGQPEAE